MLWSLFIKKDVPCFRILMRKQIVKNQGAKIGFFSCDQNFTECTQKIPIQWYQKFGSYIIPKIWYRFCKILFFQIIHHQGVNKYLSNDAAVENYGISLVMVKEYHNTLKSSCDLLCKLPPPSRVWLNCHNIVDVLVYIGGRYTVASYVLLRDFSDVFDIALHCHASLP